MSETQGSAIARVDGAAAILEELAGCVYAAAVSDALDAVGLKDQVLSSRIRPVGNPARVLVGRAATARSVPVDRVPEHPYAKTLEAIDRLSPGQVWVVAAGGRTRSAIFGGLLATAAGARGARGCVIDGAVRDTRELRRLRFPTWATGYSAADSYGRDEILEHGDPVECGGVIVHPGDLVVADEDGVVVVPAAREHEVLEHALGKIDGEGRMRSELAGGLSVAAAFTKYGIL